MTTLPEAFRRNWRRFDIPAGATVLLALSGGVDSMVLAELLLDSGIPFFAAHCNFGLRGAESDGDELFVREWAATRRIELEVRRFDLNETPGESIQMAARRLRYEWFEALRKVSGATAVLTAHHLDDQAETVLINLMRGTGLGGLQGIPMRNGAVIRPLLFASRSDLLAFAAAQDIQWREDSSNAGDKYLRNAVRHRVLPLLEELQPGSAVRIAATAERIAGAMPVYKESMSKMINRLVERRGKDWYVPIRLLRKQPGLDNLLYEIMLPYGFLAAQLPGIRALLEAPSGRQVLSPTHRLFRDRDFLIVTAARSAEADLLRIEAPESVVRCGAGELRFRLRTVPGELPDNPDIALLDAREIRFPLNLRPRREGDYFYPLGMGGKKKKLKRFLIDIKMPVPQKERVLVLEQEGKIIWVVGSRIDERFRIRHDTTEILEVRFIRAE